MMGGYRTDIPLVVRLEHAAELLHQMGMDSESETIEEAIAVIRDGVNRPSLDWIEGSLGPLRTGGQHG